METTPKKRGRPTLASLKNAPPPIVPFYFGVDWLTVRLQNFPHKERLLSMPDNSPELFLDNAQGFRLLLWGFLASWQVKVFELRSPEGERCGQLRLVVSKKDKKHRYDELDLEGHFWTAYADYRIPIFADFNISTDKQNIVTRIDYAMDFKNLSIWDVEKTVKQKDKLRRIIETSDGTTRTYVGFRTPRHDLVLYDKKLDIVDTKKYRRIWPDNSLPYLRYIHEQAPITRIEYRIKSKGFRELADNSISYLFSTPSNCLSTTSADTTPTTSFPQYQTSKGLLGRNLIQTLVMKSSLPKKLICTYKQVFPISKTIHFWKVMKGYSNTFSIDMVKGS